MDIFWLSDFIELSARGSFSRAAEARNVTQPAFSRRVRLLEEWADAVLVDRGSHPVALTQAGRDFLPFAREALATLEEGRNLARAANAQAKVTLNFATTQVLSLTYFPGWLRSILSRIQLGPINLTLDNLTACEDGLLKGATQFLLCHHYKMAPSRLSDRNFDSILIEVDRLLPVSAALPDGGPLFSLDGDENRTLPFLAYEPEAGLGRIFRSVFDIDAMKPVLRPVASSHLALLYGLALEGRGIAWVPESVMRREGETGRLVEAGSQRWSIPMEIRLFRARSDLGPAAEAFWKFVSKLPGPGGGP